MDKLQHIYDKHAGDFGLTGKKNSEQLEKLRVAIEAHLMDSETVEVRGWYRGQDAKMFHNARTHNVVVTDEHGSLIAGFKVSQIQAAYIQSTGRLN